MKTNMLFICAALSLASCVSAAMADPLYDAVVDKTLVREDGNVTIFAASDGTLTGTSAAGDLLGTWEIRNGQWCRTLSAPQRAAGSACQDMSLTDGGVKIDGRNYTVQ